MVSWSVARGGPELAPSERDLVLSALRHFDGVRYRLHSAVVMNDHVHALLTPASDHPLSKILQSWKSFTAHQLVRNGRTAPVWNANYFDQMIRDEVHFAKALIYIERNPWKRWPDLGSYPWMIPPLSTGPTHTPHTRIDPTSSDRDPMDPDPLDSDPVDPGPPGPV